MEILGLFTLGGIIVDLIIILIISLSSYWGYRNGIVAVLFKFLTFVISLIIVFLLYKPVAATIISKTELDENLSLIISNNLSGLVLKDGTVANVSAGNGMSEGIANLINSYVSEAISNAETNIIAYVSMRLAEIIVRIGTMLVLFIASRFFLLFICFAVELIENLPIINMFNKSGGLIFGVIKGFLIVYIALGVISIVAPLIGKLGVISTINESKLGSKMYNNNVILNLIIK